MQVRHLFRAVRMGFKQYEPGTSIEKGKCLFERHFCLSEVMLFQALEILLQLYDLWECSPIFSFLGIGNLYLSTRIKKNNFKQSITRIFCLSLFLPIIVPNGIKKKGGGGGRLGFHKKTKLFFFFWQRRIHLAVAIWNKGIQATVCSGLPSFLKLISGFSEKYLWDQLTEFKEKSSSVIVCTNPWYCVTYKPRSPDTSTECEYLFQSHGKC